MVYELDNKIQKKIICKIIQTEKDNQTTSHINPNFTLISVIKFI